MRFAGNVIWFVFGGWYLAITWILGALVFALSIVGLPLTKSAIEMAKLSAFPFGKDVVHIRDLDGQKANAKTVTFGALGFVVNVIWAVSFGWILFLMILLAGLLNCLTLIGIPLGLQAFKLSGISLWPVGRRVVTTELATLVREAAAKEKFEEIRR